MLNALNEFMNDNDRGPGHGLMQGAVYGLVILFIVTLSSFVLPVWASFLIWLALILANHCRVFYQEWYVERWCDKIRTGKGDFWFDILFRPFQASIIGSAALLSPKCWVIIVPLALLIGYKKKNDWPFLIFWK